jgi:hypothetical protein
MRKKSTRERGTRPLLWNHFGPDTIPLEKQEKSGVAGNDPDEWRKTVLFVPESRQLYTLPIAIFSCIREGAKFTKKGRASLMADMGATLQVFDDRVLVDRYLPAEPIPTDQNEPVYLDVQSVRNPATKARNVRRRIAASPGWTMTCIVVWDKTIIDRNQMRAVLDDAGKLVGLGDGLLALWRRAGWTNIADAVRAHAASVPRALAFIGVPVTLT